MVTIKIPVPVYLYKYLVRLYGENYQPTMYDELGIFILSVLQKKSAMKKQTELSNHWKGKLCNKEFVIWLSLSQFERHGFFLFNDKIHAIQAFVDYHFRNTLFRNTEFNYDKFGIPYKSSILSFLEKYGITEEDFSYESIRKDFNRKIKR